ncbi:MAG: TlpA family protein disulfide reductase [Chitinophagaceae bacterium]|nr:TlpA family protein disulfide reductase [Chitinophagaceae bacterium]
MKTKLFLLALATAAAWPAIAQKKSTSAKITCTIGNATPTDTIRLLVWEDNLSERSAGELPYRTYTTINEKGTFRYKIDHLAHPVYFSLVKDKEKTFGHDVSVLSQYLLEPGDDINIHMDSLVRSYTHFYGDAEDTFTGYRIVNVGFTGKGSAKGEFTSRLDSLTQHWLKTSYTLKQPPQTAQPKAYDSAYYSGYPAMMGRILEDRKAILDFQLATLKGYENKMSPEAYQITRANVIGNTEASNVRLYSLLRPSAGDPAISPSFYQSLCQQLRVTYENRSGADISGIPSAALILSKDYIHYLTDQAYYLGPKDKQYEYLKGKYTGPLRDKLIADFLIKVFFYMKDNQEALNDAVTTVQSDFALSQVKKIYNTQSIGRPAYNFTLPDIDGNIRKLSDFAGKIVFVDLWYTGCGACAKFYQYQLSRVEEKYKDDPNIVFITISIDADKATWIKSVKSGAYSSPDRENVVNLYTNGRGTEDPLIKAYNVTGYPHPFMIDRNGAIYRVNRLQAVAEELYPIIEEAIAKPQKDNKKTPASTLNKKMS